MLLFLYNNKRVVLLSTVLLLSIPFMYTAQAQNATTLEEQNKIRQEIIDEYKFQFDKTIEIMNETSWGTFLLMVEQDNPNLSFEAKQTRAMGLLRVLSDEHIGKLAQIGQSVQRVVDIYNKWNQTQQ